MIAVILILALAVAGCIWLRAAWVRLDRIEAEAAEDYDAVCGMIRDVRGEIAAEIRKVYVAIAEARRTTNGDYADLLNQITELREIERGLVEYLDDVPQNFAFHKAGVTYQLHLPERLRMVLTREG